MHTQECALIRVCHSCIHTHECRLSTAYAHPERSAGRSAQDDISDGAATALDHEQSLLYDQEVLLKGIAE